MIVPIKNIDSIKGRFRDKYIPDAISLKFDIGDKVKIVHAGLRYTSLSGALRYFNITRDQLYCREKKGILFTDDHGEIYTVQNIAIICFPNPTPIYLIHLDSMDMNNGFMIIDEKGIDFISRAYKRRAVYRSETGIRNLKEITWLIQ